MEYYNLVIKILDVKTIMFLLGTGNMLIVMLFLSLPTSANRRTEWLWTGAKVCEAIAYFAFFFCIFFQTTKFSSEISCLLYMGIALEAAALWEYRGYKNWPRFILPAVLLAVTVRTCADILEFSSRVNITISSFIVGVLLVMSTAVFVSRARPPIYLDYIIIGANIAPIIANFVRAAGSWSMMGNTLESANVINMLTYLTMFVFMVGNSFGFLLLVRRDAERKLIYLATTDVLTELFNRRAFMERAEHDLTLAGRSAVPVTLLVFDIDHFKRINDNHGHAVGSQVLRKFGRICQSLFRKSDTVGRIGGEEFATLFTGQFFTTTRSRTRISSSPRRRLLFSISTIISLLLNGCRCSAAGLCVTISPF